MKVSIHFFTMQLCGTGYNSRYKVTLRFTQIAPAGRNFLYRRHVRRNDDAYGMIRSSQLIKTDLGAC